MTPQPTIKRFRKYVYEVNTHPLSSPEDMISVSLQEDLESFILNEVRQAKEEVLSEIDKISYVRTIDKLSIVVIPLELYDKLKSHITGEGKP